MSAERISKVVLGADGKPRRRLASGRSVRLKGRTEWKRLAAMKEAELVARARSDRDARPVARSHRSELRSKKWPLAQPAASGRWSPISSDVMAHADGGP